MTSSSVLNQPPQATPPAKDRPKEERKFPTLALVAPSVVVLLLWMIVPLAMAIWFAFQRYNLLVPDNREFVGFGNFTFILTDPALWTSIVTTLVLVGSVLVITIGLGTLLAVLFNQDFPGQGDCSRAGDFPLLRDADCERVDLEKHADAPGQRAICSDYPRAGARCH